MSRGIRFAPPRLAADLLPDLSWLLARAFGPAGESPRPADPTRAVALARRLGIASRIAARTDFAALTADLGSAAADLRAESRLAAAIALRLDASIRAIAGAAAGAGIPIGFLKYAALELSGVLAPGSRSATDVDVLAPAGREKVLCDALIAAGFAVGDGPDYEHQLAPQIHPRLGAVEVHRLVLGVRLGGGSDGTDDRRSATLDALIEAGLTVACRSLPGTVVLPRPVVLAAHAAVHGLGQHGFEPSAYPALRTFADLLDLGWGGPTARQSAERIAHWLAEDLSAAELAALVELCADLAAGRAPLDGEGDPSLLLRHALAGRLDPAYESALKLALFSPRPSDKSPSARRLTTLAAALWPSAAQLDEIYGRTGGRWGLICRRLWRPFDLLARSFRAAAGAGRVARGDRRPDGGAPDS